MRDTSHSPIGPCGPLEQSPFGDNFRHALTALLSSGLVSGENAGVGWGGGKTLGLSSKFGMGYDESMQGFIHDAGLAFGMYICARTTTTRI